MPGQSERERSPGRTAGRAQRTRPGESDTPLVGITLPRPEAARAVTAAWDRDEAVVVLDPQAPAAAWTALLDAIRPTHVLDGQGRRARPGGQPVPAGTAAVVVTSGTTGAPKGVELTFAGLESIGEAFAAAFDALPDDRALVCLPLHHVAGLAILARARVAETPVITHPGFDLAAVAAAPRVEGATIVSLVPTMLRRLLDAGAPVHEYRYIIVGGAPTPSEWRARADATGARVVDAYGLSETWGGIVLDGEPVQGAEVSLSDNGEILARGTMVMRAYRLAARATTDAFTTDGWFRTGDVGELRDGRLHVVDRARDLVITGGVNVSPTAVESVLVRHADVADVCVAGAPDPEWGERVVAFVVPREGTDPPTLEDLRSFGRDHLSPAQLPKQLVVVDAIPRTAGGKALRRELRVPQ